MLKNESTMILSVKNRE